LQGSYGIAAFRSRQQVLLLENVLRREGIKVDIINTPRDVALGCGLSVRFDMQDMDSVRRVIAARRPSNMVGMYRVDFGGGRSRLTPMGTYSR